MHLGTSLKITRGIPYVYINVLKHNGRTTSCQDLALQVARAPAPDAWSLQAGFLGRFGNGWDYCLAHHPTRVGCNGGSESARVTLIQQYSDDVGDASTTNTADGVCNGKNDWPSWLRH